jgi:hypothetical protein
MKNILYFFPLLLLCSSFLYADIINVPSDTDSIQGGIDLANHGDTVLVHPGAYLFGINEGINFNGKNIVLGSLFLTTGDTSYILQTVIGGVVIFENGEDSTAILSGFTINGARHFGGIIVSNSSPSISYMNIINNHHWHRGGGIEFNNSKSQISNLKIKSNWTGSPGGPARGGGVFSFNSNLSFSNVEISNNGTGLQGGGIFCRDSKLNILFGTIIGNTAGTEGGGIYLDSSFIYLSHVTIKQDSAELGGGIYIDSSSQVFFDPANRCNIYYNYSDLNLGSDLCKAGDSEVSVIVDTFTVLIPDSTHAYPLNKFNFDIKNSGVTNLSENSFFPKVYILNQNYPNPFNPRTNIQFSIPKAEFVTLNIYNTQGQKVSTLVSEKLTPGEYNYVWDASAFASGVYYYSLSTRAGYVQTRKLVLIK